MSTAVFRLLVKTAAIVAAMPREHSATKAAEALLRAAAAGPDAAQRILLLAGVLDVAAVLVSAAYTLRATGHFESAQIVDSFATVIRSWERREQARPPRRRSDGVA